MKILKIPCPYEVRVIEIKQNTNESMNILQDLIDLEYRPFKLSLKTKKPFYGNLYGTKFEIVRKNLLYGNSFRPILNGEFILSGEKNYLVMTAHLYEFAKFSVFFAITLLTSGIILAYTQFKNHGGFFFSFVFLVFSMLFYAMFMSYFKLDLKKSMSVIENEFKGKELFNSTLHKTCKLGNDVEMVVRSNLKINYFKWLAILISIFLYLKYL